MIEFSRGSFSSLRFQNDLMIDIDKADSLYENGLEMHLMIQIRKL
jgi:hypothetical protein